ncbi:MAG: hypothetical protein AAGD96_36690 [Chloroflexota bacterium]
MNKQEILEICKWKEDEGWFGQFECVSPLLDQTIEIHLIVNNDYQISDRTLAIVNAFLGLNERSLPEVKRFLWEGCQLCCEEISYGVEVKEGQTETEANHEAFGVFNGDDAFKKSSFMYLLINESNEEFVGNYGLLNFDNEWESHISVVVMKDGEIVGHGESGVYVGQFESH